MFRKFISVIPTAICGLALGISALSNLLYIMEWDVLATIFLIISVIVVGLFILKCIQFPRIVLKELSDRNICATFPTITMTFLTLLYILYHQLNITWEIINWLWWIIVILQFIIIGVFIYYHIYLRKNERIVPSTSWFVTFVGIGVISETAEDFSPFFGELIVYIATLCFLVLICIVLFKKSWRLYNENQFPMTIIIAAPASLCLNGYLLSAEHTQLLYTMPMLIISQLTFIYSLTFLPKLYKLNFRFSFSALTFPWVTTATSLYNLIKIENLPHKLHSVLYFITVLEVTFAIMTVIYVILGYASFLKKRTIEIK
ncbi:TDT family transporter [Staphylococcus equorum]|uniref:TDT family transporter n=1 Tax=Staphylococcus equorum TaxID=246432 RepID=A0A9X4R2C0_9STAP|nr:TDT family transporter [Staphylococcus equorum]MDG0843794.1 TDT family transporter [Staphylococcus equorum]MDG0860085.1 TDT family transporter [Staphylococcus equorum]